MVRSKDSHIKFEAEKTIQPFFSGGNVALSEDGLFLATSLGEDAFLTYIPTERQLLKIAGVCHIILAKMLDFLTC